MDITTLLKMSTLSTFFDSKFDTSTNDNDTFCKK